jgi:hypothetical protein
MAAISSSTNMSTARRENTPETDRVRLDDAATAVARSSPPARAIASVGVTEDIRQVWPT